jgi:hypothetical protein
MHTRIVTPRKRAGYVLLILGFISVLVSGCGPLGLGFNCPSLNDNVTWTSYGRFQFRNAGDDSTARKCVSHCGWHVFQGNDGGVGSTLQVASPGEEVVFAWAYNQFSAYRVVNGWTGQTDRGVRLGDSLTTFQNRYPEFRMISATHWTFSDPSNGTQVDAYFDENNLLTEILVGPYIVP